MRAVNQIEDDNSRVQQYLTFMLGGKTYALEILNVREIITYGEITELPMMPDFIAGVINLRGSVVPIVDLVKRLSGKAVIPDKRTSIIILDVNNDDISIQLGIIVDRVQEVLDISSADIEPSLSLGKDIESTFISGMAKVKDTLLVLLSIANVLSIEELSLAGSMPENITND